MAYDEELADRIRDLVEGRPATSERRMFGGLAFLVGGNMAVAASGSGGLMVRVDPDQGDELVQTTRAEPMEMRGREMTGWLRVADNVVTDDAELARWVGIGVDYAAGLPPK